MSKMVVGEDRRGAGLIAMRRIVIASIVVVAACSDDGVPQDAGTSAAEGTGDDDADTISSTVTLDSTDTSPSTTAPSGTSGDTTDDSISTLGDTTDPSTATAEGESTHATDPDSSSDAGEATTGETSMAESSSTGEPPPTSESSSSDAESESTGGNAPLCGDGIVQESEACDSDDLGDNESCVDLGYTAGVLSCNPGSCQYDESDCNDEPAFAIDFCRLQFPTSAMGNAGAVLDVFGRVYVGGLTDLSQLNDPALNVVMQVGYGEDGSDPEIDDTWAWFPAGPNVGYGPGSPGFEMNNDEYVGQMILPPAGEYDFAVRFTGDGGATWTVCDGGDEGSANGYAPADAGQLSTQ